MQQKLQQFLAATLFTIGSMGAAQAQTISTFEDVILAGPDTTYLETKFPTDGVYTFQSGNALFYGNVTYNTLWGNFNCSNGTDTVNPSYSVTAAAITGSGYDTSANYGIAFVPTDYTNMSNPSATIPVGAKLTGAAAGHLVTGVYYTNAVYAYRYMLLNNSYATNHYFLKLVMRGYLNGNMSSDSVVATLADFTGSNTTLVNTWQWADLTSLGNVDSVTFDLVSNDTAGGFGINTPAYFAIDNLTTLDNACPAATNISVSNITANVATVSWTNSIPSFDANYQVAVDQTPALTPTGNTFTATGLTYTVSGLSSNIQYYAHVRSACPNGGFSDWDTTSFRTLGATAINETPKNALNVVISPNPAQDFIQLNVAIPVAAAIYNLEGKLLMNASNAKQINISALSAGTYFVRVTSINDNSKQAVLRFTKQ